MSDTPSVNLVLQRIRNRIIEYFALTASFDAQVNYQLNAPLVNVPLEVINQWEDWVQPDWQQYMTGPVFTQDELDAIGQFSDVWCEVSKKTPNPLPSLDTLFNTLEWQQLADSSAKALTVFQLRGQLSEQLDDHV
jgi:hypothetical protein